MDLFGQILSGIGGGLLYGLVGYVNASGNGEKFDAPKLVISLVISGVVGAISGLTGLTNTEVSTGAFSVVVTQALGKLWTTINK